MKRYVFYLIPVLIYFLIFNICIYIHPSVTGNDKIVY